MSALTATRTLPPVQLISTITNLLLKHSTTTATGASAGGGAGAATPPPPSPLHVDLNPYIPHLTPPILHSILSSPSLLKHPSNILLNFIEWAKSNSPLISIFPLPISHIISLISSLYSHKKFNEIKDVLHSHILSEHPHHTLHRHLIDPDKPLPESPNMIFGSCVVAYCRAGYPNLSAQIFKKMTRHRIRPSLYTVSIMLTSLVKNKSPDTSFCLELFNDAVKLGVKPNVVIFSILITGYCSEGKMDDALGVLKKMEDDFKCKPNIICYTIILQAFSERRKLHNVQETLTRMKINGVPPDVDTYNVLVHGYCERGWYGDAAKLIEHMERDSLLSNVRTFTVLITGLRKNGRIDEALRLKGEMEQLKMFPNVVTYNTLIHGCFEMERVAEAFQLMDEMKEKNLIADEFTHNIIIRWYCKEGRMDKAIEMFKSMEDNGFSPDSITYYNLTSGYCKVGNLARANEMIDQMEVKGLEMDVTVRDVGVLNLIRERKLNHEKGPTCAD